MSSSAIPLQPLSLRHEIGEVIKDRYTVGAVLGAGAFGTVYRVEETIGSRQVVRACKEMHVMNDPQTTVDERGDALRMFQEEAYLLETLRNTHIPAAHFDLDKGAWQACPVCGRTFHGLTHCPAHASPLQTITERYYLLMDFIEGHDLEERLRTNSGRPLEENEVIDWGLQICDALEAVHARGFSHRDIKPANIKIHRESGQAMLIDFGLVRPSTAAGGYGTVLKRNSTGAGTLGYAPPSPQEQAQPDARTDILALGMTLYRLLTVRDPTEPAELEEMRARAPRAFNPQLSSAIDEIIVKCTQVDPERRYAAVENLRTDLRAARYPYTTTCPNCGFVHRSARPPDDATQCERCGRLLQPTPAPRLPAQAARGPAGTTVLANPYSNRIRQLRDEINKPIATPNSTFDARIAEIEKKLAPVAQFPLGTDSDECPACRQADLKEVTGQPTGECPLCRMARLRRRPLDPRQCAVCRAGVLREKRLGPDEMFCPACRIVPLPLERRRRFGSGIDSARECASCGAQLEGHDGIEKLVRLGSGPAQNGQPHLDEAHTLQEWKHLIGRSDRYRECEACAAQFDCPHDNALTLAYYARDPHGIGARTVGETFTLAAWARLAHGVEPTAGTHYCPNCKGEFDVDRAAQTMTLLDSDATLPDWARRWRGIAVSLPTWYLAAHGKQSMWPGLVCPSCHIEFDREGILLKLVAAPPGPLKPLAGRVMTSDDWRRIGRAIPTASETSQLRGELKRLEQARREETINQTVAQQRRQYQLESELTGLLKQSIIEGFVPLKRMNVPKDKNDLKQGRDTFVAIPLNDLHIPLRASEMLRWEATANRCKVEMNRGALECTREGNGILIVTTERVIFVTRSDRGPQVWQRAVEQINEVQLAAVQDSAVLVLYLKDLPKPVGFEMTTATWDLVLEGTLRPIIMTPQDLVSLFYLMA